MGHADSATTEAAEPIEDIPGKGVQQTQRSPGPVRSGLLFGWEVVRAWLCSWGAPVIKLSRRDWATAMKGSANWKNGSDTTQ